MIDDRNTKCHKDNKGNLVTNVTSHCNPELLFVRIGFIKPIKNIWGQKTALTPI